MGTKFGQWEFPERESRAAEEPMSVSSLTRRIRAILESGFRSVRVRGEVSNLRRQASGHTYFTLKGGDCQLSCVLFRSRSARSKEALEEGIEVVASGAVTVYEPRGQYQLTVSSVERAGVGALWRQFEALKERLRSEGLFDASRKRPIPKFIFDIGLVTSESGAAIRDVAHVAFRRFPGVRLWLSTSRVQGEGAAEEISDAIARLEHWAEKGHPLDVILVTRGGGSLEDLWAFNEEAVVRSIAACSIPTVSAIGHETDQLLSDYAADLRAATPSAAAEALTAGVLEASSQLEGWMQRGRYWVDRGVAERRKELARLVSRLAYVSPKRRLERGWQRLDELNSRLSIAPRRSLSEGMGRSEATLRRWRSLNAVNLLRDRRERLGLALSRMSVAMGERMARSRAAWERSDTALRAMNPSRLLERGYSITVDEAGAVITDAQDLTEGSHIRTRFRRGEALSEVRELRTD